MLFCTKCGTQLQEGSTLCPNCGADMLAEIKAANLKKNQQEAEKEQAKKEKTKKKGKKILIAVLAGTIAAALLILCISIPVSRMIIKKQAGEFDGMAGSLNVSSLSDEDEVKACRDFYESLSKRAKARVEHYDDLTAAEAKIDHLTAVANDKEAPEAFYAGLFDYISIDVTEAITAERLREGIDLQDNVSAADDIDLWISDDSSLRNLRPNMEYQVQIGISDEADNTAFYDLVILLTDNEGAWGKAPTAVTIRVDYEKSILSSGFDVDMYFNHGSKYTKICTIRQGEQMVNTFTDFVLGETYAIVFTQAGETTVLGSESFLATKDVTVKCTIRASFGFIEFVSFETY